MLRHSQISTIWRSLGADKAVVDDPGAFVPIRPFDGSVHPVYDDWTREAPQVDLTGLTGLAAPERRRMLPIVGVGV
jgi:hypothetical protein